MVHEVAVLVRVTGRVQGVWFRGWTRDEARALGLRGWVRNDPDGAVTALLAGPEPRVAEMVAELHRGPPQARVVSVETEPAEMPAGAGFEVVR